MFQQDNIQPLNPEELTNRELDRIIDVYYRCGGLSRENLEDVFAQLMVKLPSSGDVESAFEKNTQDSGSAFLHMNGLINLVKRSKGNFLSSRYDIQSLEAADAFLAIGGDGPTEEVSGTALSELLSNEFTLDLCECNFYEKEKAFKIEDFQEALKPTMEPKNLKLFVQFGAVEDDTGTLCAPIKVLKERLLQSSVGATLNAAAVNTFLEECDDDGDGVIDYDEFMQILSLSQAVANDGMTEKFQKLLQKDKRVFLRHTPAPPNASNQHQASADSYNNFSCFSMSRNMSVNNHSLKTSGGVTKEFQSDKRSCPTPSSPQILSSQFVCPSSPLSEPSAISDNSTSQTETVLCSPQGVAISPDVNSPSTMAAPTPQRVFIPSPNLHFLRHPHVPEAFSLKNSNSIHPSPPPEQSSNHSAGSSYSYVKSKKVKRVTTPPPRFRNLPFKVRTPSPYYSKTHRGYFATRSVRRREMKFASPWAYTLSQIVKAEGEWISKEYENIIYPIPYPGMEEDSRYDCSTEELPPPPTRNQIALMIQRTGNGLHSRLYCHTLRTASITIASWGKMVMSSSNKRLRLQRKAAAFSLVAVCAGVLLLCTQAQIAFQKLGLRVRRHLDQMFFSASKIQNVARVWKAKRELRNMQLLITKYLAVENAKQQLAFLLSPMWKQHHIQQRKLVRNRYSAASRIRSFWLSCKYVFEKRRKQALLLKIRDLESRVDLCTVTIQCWYRQVLARRIVLGFRIIRFVAVLSAAVASGVSRLRIEQASSLTIVRAVREHQASKKLRVKKKVTRLYILRFINSDNILDRRLVKAQQLTRTWFAKRYYASITIQRNVRCFISKCSLTRKRKLIESYITHRHTEDAVCVIQRSWRCCLAVKRLREKQHQGRSACIIQRAVRCLLSFKKLHSYQMRLQRYFCFLRSVDSLVVVQKSIRYFIARVAFLRLQQSIPTAIRNANLALAAPIIQRAVRCLLSKLSVGEKKKRRDWYLIDVQDVNPIQVGMLPFEK